MIQEFEAIVQKIESDFERAVNLPHHGITGATREQTVIKHFLEQYLPHKYKIGSGLITDSGGSFSRQQDIVIYDGFNTPVLQDFDANKVFFAEQVYAAIEVKSTLTYEEVKDIIVKANSISALKRQGNFRLIPSNELRVIIDEPRIYTFGFAHRSKLSLYQIRDYIQKKINNNEFQWNVSAILVLHDKDGKSGIVSNVDAEEVNLIKVVPTQGDPIASITSKSKGEALFSFYLQFMQALNIAESTSVSPDYLEYAKSAGLGTIDLAVGKLGVQGTKTYEAIDIFKNAHKYSNEEIIESYYHLNSYTEKVGLPIVHYLENARFIIGEQIIHDPKPKDIWDSLLRYKEGNADSKDRRRLDILVDMIRKISKESSCIQIVTPTIQDVEVQPSET